MILSIFSQSGVPEKFEELIASNAHREEFSFLIGVKDVYGNAEEELLITLPKSQFSQEQGFSKEMLEEGIIYP
jgi:FKBP-type peptidyl-prolyl cis-trans isomerase SlyD